MDAKNKKKRRIGIKSKLEAYIMEHLMYVPIFDFGYVQFMFLDIQYLPEFEVPIVPIWISIVQLMNNQHYSGFMDIQKRIFGYPVLYHSVLGYHKIMMNIGYP